MASALFVGILIARYLGPESYGLMNYVISYVAIFSIIATFGMDNIEIRELSRQNDKKDAIMGTCFCLRMFFATIAYIVIAISLFYFQTDKFTSLMVLAYGLTLFTGTGNLLRNYFTSIVQNKYIASGYYLSYKSTVGSIRKWHFDKTLVPFILKESFPLVLSGAAVIIYQRIDQVMIGDMINKTEVGYFATAGKFVDLIVFLPMVLVQTVTPMLVREKENKPETYEVKKKTFVSITTWTAIIMSVMVSSLSYWLITYTYGIQYAPAIPVLQIMAFKAVGMALSSAGGQIIIMEHIQKWAFIRNILGCILCVLLNYFLIPQYGIIGSSYVTIITVLFTGCFANLLIPTYHNVMKLQLYAILLGWKELRYFKRMIRK